MESDSSLRGEVDHAFFSSDSDAGTKETVPARDQQGTGTATAENLVRDHTTVPVKQVAFGHNGDSNSTDEDVEGRVSSRVRAQELANEATLDAASGEGTLATGGHKEEGEDIETTPRAESESSRRSSGSGSSSSGSDGESSQDDGKSNDDRKSRSGSTIEDDVNSDKSMKTQDCANSESDGKLEDDSKSKGGSRSHIRAESVDRGKSPGGGRRAESPGGARSRRLSGSRGSAKSDRDSSSDGVRSRSSIASKKSVVASQSSVKSQKSATSRGRSRVTQGGQESAIVAGGNVKTDSSSSDEEEEGKRTAAQAVAQVPGKQSRVVKKSTSDIVDGSQRSPRQAKPSKKQDRKADIWQAPANRSMAKPVKTAKQTASSTISSSSTLSPLSSRVEVQSGGGGGGGGGRLRSSRVLSDAEDLNHLLKAVVAMETGPKTRRSPGDSGSAASRALRVSAYGNLRRPLRSNYSFSEEQVRGIDRDNQRLLERLCRLSLPPLPPTARHAGGGSVVMVPSRPYHTAVMRERALRRIQEENLLILRRLEAVRPTPGLSRAELLLQYSRQAAYMGGPTWVPSSQPRRGRRLGVHSSV